MTAAPEAPARIRAARAADLRGMSLVLARAFRDDPVHRWMLPGELDWALFSAPIFATVIRESRRAGGAEISAGMEGVALWFPPYGPLPSTGQRSAAFALGLLALGRRTARVGHELGRLESARPLEPHWYLAVLGTDPRHQGQGIGSALLNLVLERCDADRIPAYLESSKPSNVSFYERHGFSVEGEIRFEDGPTLSRMRREPQP